MAQLFFKYGSMNSGKSMDILKVAHNYEEQGKAVLLMTSGVDDRAGQGKIASRVGLERDVVPIFNATNVYDLVKQRDEKLYCILVDEAQFLTRDHIIQLARIVDDLNIPVMAYGLKNDFRNQLFEGSQNLLIYADKIEEIKTICWFCSHKAIMNLRIHDGKPVYEGEQIQIGGNESYYPVCRKHYFHPVLPAVKE
ncbi:thymidine kinase [Limosilactobacillus equigenerosi]|uniref:Thymidine kinase n=1 Tax=Limosilactobacillus equigenerosi DSM 18793 = JCM 14505 TaxID=1423742 RepID=A0A0R1UTK6_9LACO|nr:thymidine kinase [Limosilactobacillus equigenerosi]KRL96525.1 Thymidine kinase [Limosilactobacillus equigenerosi DSM 18793 = JCM 14505]MCQ2569556.1 thymidine kinase [Limosilactobacillus sp.]